MANGYANGHASVGTGHAPICTGHAPTGTGHTPMCTGHAPTCTGHAPTGTGHAPAGTGTSCMPRDPDVQATSDMEDTLEFRLLMSYAQRRRPGDVRLSARGGPSARQRGADASGTGAPGTCSETGKEKKKKKKKKGLKEKLRLFSCVGHTEEEEEHGDSDAVSHFRTMGQAHDDGGMLEVACRLTEIADGIDFTPSDIESDGQEDEVEKLIGLLLRESGDRFSEEVLKDASLARELLGNYWFFERLMSAFLSRIGFTTFNPEAPGSQGSPRTQIALTCEVTSRLSAVEVLPMNRLMGFGAKYLQQHYSTWAAQQGGYEEAFQSEDDDEVH